MAPSLAQQDCAFSTPKTPDDTATMESPAIPLQITVAAFHEAGHALAALKEGRFVHRVVVSGRNPGAGVCSFERKPQNPFDITGNHGTAMAAWEHTVKMNRADMRIYLAGPLAEAKIPRKPLRSIGSESDLQHCLQTAPRLHNLREFASGYAKIKHMDVTKMWKEEHARVKRWLNRPFVWKTVDSIA